MISTITVKMTVTAASVTWKNAAFMALKTGVRYPDQVIQWGVAREIIKVCRVNVSSGVSRLTNGWKIFEHRGDRRRSRMLNFGIMYWTMSSSDSLLDFQDLDLDTERAAPGHVHIHKNRKFPDNPSAFLLEAQPILSDRKSWIWRNISSRYNQTSIVEEPFYCILYIKPMPSS